jgi:hypothetical protein
MNGKQIGIHNDMVIAYLNILGECDKHKIHDRYIIRINLILTYLIYEVRKNMLQEYHTFVNLLIIFYFNSLLFSYLITLSIADMGRMSKL